MIVCIMIFKQTVAFEVKTGSLSSVLCFLTPFSFKLRDRHGWADIQYKSPLYAMAAGNDTFGLINSNCEYQF